MSKSHPIAVSSGRVRLGKWEIDCHVLEDGRRVITQTAFLEMMGSRGRGNDRGHRMIHFLMGQECKHLNITNLTENIQNPFIFRPQKGGIAYGYEGSIIIDYCDILLKARRQGLIGGEVITQYCEAAEMLVSSVAKVGIVALIDEATGYQQVRPRDALQAILDRYLRSHWASWAKRFPDEFYSEMFRLKEWDWKGMSINRPSVVGHYTNDLVYKRLAPGVLEELKLRNPIESGRRKQKHHQWLTDDVGHPELNQHLYALLAFMKVAKDWNTFKRMVDKAFPKIGESYLLNLGEDFVE